MQIRSESYSTRNHPSLLIEGTYPSSYNLISVVNNIFAYNSSLYIIALLSFQTKKQDKKIAGSHNHESLEHLLSEVYAPILTGCSVTINTGIFGQTPKPSAKRLNHRLDA